MTLALELTVNRIVSRPLSAAVGIGRFRTSGGGANVKDNTVSIVKGQTYTVAGSASLTVVRTNKPLVATITKADANVVILPVDSLLVLSCGVTNVVLAYSESSAPVGDIADVSIIQS